MGQQEEVIRVIQERAQKQMIEKLIERYIRGEKYDYFLTNGVLDWLKAQPEYKKEGA